MDIFSDTTGEKYLYRYRGPSERTLEEVEHLYFHASNKKQLNDVNEFRCSINDGPSNYSIEKMHALLQGGFEQYQPDKANIFTQQCLSALSTGKEEYRSFIRRSFFSHKENLVERSKEIFKDYEKCRITCFSKNPLSPTMFGLYGNNKGILVCYDVAELTKIVPATAFVHVDYQEKPYSFNAWDMIERREESNLGRELQIGFVGTKHLDWKYEREVRIICADDIIRIKGSEATAYSGVRTEMSSVAIKSICLAPNVDHSFACKLYKLCKKWGIEVFKAQHIDGEYKLSAEKYYAKEI